MREKWRNQNIEKSSKHGFADSFDSFIHCSIIKFKKLLSRRSVVHRAHYFAQIRAHTSVSRFSLIILLSKPKPQTLRFKIQQHIKTIVVSNKRNRKRKRKTNHHEILCMYSSFDPTSWYGG